MADQSFCAKRLDWDAPVTEVQTLNVLNPFRVAYENVR